MNSIAFVEMYQGVHICEDSSTKRYCRTPRKEVNQRMSKQPPLICRNGCGQQLWFDWERKFDDLGYTQNSEKPNIPLEVAEDGEHLPRKHQCPNSEYAKKQQEGKEADRGGSYRNDTTKENLSTVALQGILGNTLDLLAKLDKLQNSFDELVKEQKGNPLDDDGDSSRENDESPEQ